jgi:hypothetical protein
MNGPGQNPRFQKNTEITQRFDRVKANRFGPNLNGLPPYKVKSEL